MTRCPHCKHGPGLQIACSPSGCETRTAVCRTCHGTQEITEEIAAKIDLGERLRQKRISDEMSQRERAEYLGITPKELNELEHGR